MSKINKNNRKRSRRARKVIDSTSSENETEKENQIPSETPQKSNLEMLLSSSPNLGSKKECEEELKEIQNKYNLRAEKLNES